MHFFLPSSFFKDWFIWERGRERERERTGAHTCAYALGGVRREKEFPSRFHIQLGAQPQDPEITARTKVRCITDRVTQGSQSCISYTRNEKTDLSDPLPTCYSTFFCKISKKSIITFKLFTWLLLQQNTNFMTKQTKNTILVYFSFW